jgi:8-oxo-dGTP pyrophosphatase MutT (NUDIX family)
MPTSEATLVHRQAVRALILTPDHQVLLCRIHAPGDDQSFWIAPGGGLEPGETQDEGLRRELLEELGLTEFEAGPVVWRRHHTFDWGDRRLSQKEEFRVVHVDRFDPVMTDEVAEVLECFRWWPIDELATSTERFTPLSLADILRRYLRDGAPSTPPDEEVLVD